jgi:hypothetical protein
LAEEAVEGETLVRYKALNDGLPVSPVFAIVIDLGRNVERLLLAEGV